MADEPVVVSKIQPMKASNGVEGKTGLTNSPVCWRHSKPKARMLGEGVKLNLSLSWTGVFFFTGTEITLASEVIPTGGARNSHSGDRNRTRE